jgi:hypothetical protein
MHIQLKQSGVINVSKSKYGPIPPGPQDLTEEKILKRMARIHIGDVIRFDSMKECFTADQVDRHSGTIKADGVVVEHCGGYVMVKLRRGLLESVSYFDIEKVNGHGFPGYISRMQSAQSLRSMQYMKEQLWS